MESGIPWFNTIIIAGATLLAAGVLIATNSPEWGIARAHRASVRARLPFGSDEVALTARRHMRRLLRTDMWGLLATCVVAFGVLAFIPGSDSPFTLWMFTGAILLVAAATSAYTSLRERLFSPAPTALRVARGREMRVGDYIDPLRRHLPSVVLTLATVGTAIALTWASIGPAHDSSTTLANIVALLAALLIAYSAVAGSRIAERAILRRPQPAANPLQLAWDDLFRADALGGLRLFAALAAWIPFGIAAVMLSQAVGFAGTSPAGSLAWSFPWWGIPLLQVIYTFGSGKLPGTLHPGAPLPVPVTFASQEVTA